jgi:DNA-binding NarL/FixJ family response regulator
LAGHRRQDPERRARVLLAEDHAHVAAQLRAVLEPEFEVIATVGDGHDLIAAAARLCPDIIVTDISMPGLDGIAATREIRRGNPTACIVLVTVHNEPSLVQRGLAAGAMGYVLKLTAGDELAPAVHAALQGERYVSGTCRTVPCWDKEEASG